jgi:hypothetical protein
MINFTNSHIEYDTFEFQLFEDGDLCIMLESENGDSGHILVDIDGVAKIKQFLIDNFKP